MNNSEFPPNIKLAKRPWKEGDFYWKENRRLASGMAKKMHLEKVKNWTSFNSESGVSNKKSEEEKSQLDNQSKKEKKNKPNSAEAIKDNQSKKKEEKKAGGIKRFLKETFKKVSGLKAFYSWQSYLEEKGENIDEKLDGKENIEIQKKLISETGKTLDEFKIKYFLKNKNNNLVDWAAITETFTKKNKDLLPWELEKEWFKKLKRIKKKLEKREERRLVLKKKSVDRYNELTLEERKKRIEALAETGYVAGLYTGLLTSGIPALVALSLRLSAPALKSIGHAKLEGRLNLNEAKNGILKTFKSLNPLSKMDKEERISYLSGTVRLAFSTWAISRGIGNVFGAEEFVNEVALKESPLAMEDNVVLEENNNLSEAIKMPEKSELNGISEENRIETLGSFKQEDISEFFLNVLNDWKNPEEILETPSGVPADNIIDTGIKDEGFVANESAIKVPKIEAGDGLSNFLSKSFDGIDGRMWSENGMIETLKEFTQNDPEKASQLFNIEANDFTNTGFEIDKNFSVENLENLKEFYTTNGFDDLKWDSNILESGTLPQAEITAGMENLSSEIGSSEMLAKLAENNPEKLLELKEYNIKSGESLSESINNNIFNREILGEKFSQIEGDSIKKGRLMTLLLNDISSQVEKTGSDNIFGFGNRDNINIVHANQNPNMLEIIKRAENILINHTLTGNIKAEGVWVEDVASRQFGVNNEEYIKQDVGRVISEVPFSEQNNLETTVNISGENIKITPEFFRSPNGQINQFAFDLTTSGEELKLLSSEVLKENWEVNISDFNQNHINDVAVRVNIMQKVMEEMAVNGKTGSEEYIFLQEQVRHNINSIQREFGNIFSVQESVVGWDSTETENIQGIEESSSIELDKQNATIAVNRDVQRLYGGKSIWGGIKEGSDSLDWQDFRNRDVSEIMKIDKEYFELKELLGDDGFNHNEVGTSDEKSVFKTQVYVKELIEKSGLEPLVNEKLEEFMLRAYNEIPYMQEPFLENDRVIGEAIIKVVGNELFVGTKEGVESINRLLENIGNKRLDMNENDFSKIKKVFEGGIFENTGDGFKKAMIRIGEINSSIKVKKLLDS